MESCRTIISRNCAVFWRGSGRHAERHAVLAEDWRLLCVLHGRSAIDKAGTAPPEEANWMYREAEIESQLRKRAATASNWPLFSVPTQDYQDRRR